MKTLLGLLLTSALLTLFEDTTAVTAQVVTNMGVADAVKNFVDAAEDDGEGTSSNCVGRDVMVIAAHPDDEVVCCSGVISRAVKHGMCVQVVVLTNGEYFGSTAKRGIERQRELLEGLKKLGLNDPNSAIFLGYPDNALKTLYIDYNNKNTFFTTNKM